MVITRGPCALAPDDSARSHSLLQGFDRFVSGNIRTLRIAWHRAKTSRRGSAYLLGKVTRFASLVFAKFAGVDLGVPVVFALFTHLVRSCAAVGVAF